jgi:hypothetical protein
LHLLPVLQQDPLQHVPAEGLQEKEERKHQQNTYTALPTLLTEGPNLKDNKPLNDRRNGFYRMRFFTVLSFFCDALP